MNRREQISPELVLIDPELARPLDELETVMIDPLNPNQNDESPSIETLMFKAGLITADDLGELVRDAVVAQRPVAALAVERNLVTPRALETLLEQARADEASAPEPPVAAVEPPIAPVVEPVLVAAEPAPAELETHIALAPQPVPEPAPQPTLEPEPQPEPEPEPMPPAAVAEPTPLHVVEPGAAEAGAAFEVVVLLANGQTARVGDAPSRDAAEQLARETARRFADATEWPLVGGRCIRPDLVVSVDVLRKLED